MSYSTEVLSRIYELTKEIFLKEQRVIALFKMQSDLLRVLTLNDMDKIRLLCREMILTCEDCDIVYQKLTELEKLIELGSKEAGNE